jgi:transposase
MDVLGRRRQPKVYLNKIQIARAVTLIEEGHSRRRVAQMMNVSHSAISRAWIRHLAYGIVQRCPYPQRQRSTTPREDRLLTRWALQERRISARALQNRLVASTGTRISDQTVRNRLHATQFRARKQAKVPRLTPVHRRNRRNFAQLHRDWTPEQWSNVLFTDESRFCHNDGRIQVWRRPGERYIDSTVQETVAFGGRSIMVWGGITLTGRTELVVLRGGSLTAVRYLRDIVEPHVVPFAENMGRDFILQQDNARPHIAGIVRNCFNDHNIEVMEWPANSSDLNPIEHLWDTLNKRIREHQPIRNLQHVEEVLLQEWELLPQEAISNLIRSMPRRCAELIRIRGGHTSY